MRTLVVVLAFAANALGQSAETMQKLLDAEGAKLRAWGSDAVVVAAVKAQNAKRTPLATIQALDAKWSGGSASDLVKQTTTGACADRLRQLIAGGGAYGETFVMDNQGALVCATTKTSDYWQGDEAKWQRAWSDGKGALFIDRPRFDDSSSSRIAQISFPILDNGAAIGTMTVGVSIEKLR